MGKIVYSRYRGSFDLSDKAICRYAELKGIKLYPQTNNGPFGPRIIWWTIPEGERARKCAGWPEPRLGKTETELAYGFIDKNMFDFRKIMKNDDPHLAQAILEVAGEEIWWAVGGDNLPVPRIRDLPAGTLYRICGGGVITRDEHRWIEAQHPRLKIVLDSSFLSDGAIIRYCEIKGVPLFPEFGSDGFVKAWWTIPKEERNGMSMSYNEPNLSREESEHRWRLFQDNTFSEDMIESDDPILVQVCEELGSLATIEHCSYVIRELSPGQRYSIEIDDLAETLILDEEVDWKTAL